MRVEEMAGEGLAFAQLVARPLAHRRVVVIVRTSAARGRRRVGGAGV